ncbi:DUF7848 domain-containing protein [Streptomyces sp. NBC_00704]|uniref:DUF7848 domain-containing protein n=1 Tax=Streptomyces sp. NBC_00704 TaxID=2975809 RepID=UPI003FA6FEA0
MTALRSRWRFVDYTIAHVPESGVTWDIFCATDGCGESQTARTDEVCAEWAMRHAAMSGHALFRRTCSDRAVVTRQT